MTTEQTESVMLTPAPEQVVRDLKPWEIEFYRRKKQLQNYRGRRMRACTAADDLIAVIENLGVESDPSILPIPDHEMPKPPSEAIRDEMQNTVANLLRLILLHNDGQVSRSELNRF